MRQIELLETLAIVYRLAGMPELADQCDARALALWLDLTSIETDGEVIEVSA